jgi:AcrR family transcriptional regulator
MPEQWSIRPARPLRNGEPRLFGEGTAMTERKDDRRSRRSQRLIVDALLVLMLEKRFDRITVQEILDRADVGRTTFYAQFRNKEDVLELALEHVFGQLQDQQLASRGEPADRLLPSRELFRHVQETHSLYPALLRGLALDPHYQAVQRSLRDVVARQLALANGSHDLAVPPELIAEYLAGAFLTLVHWWLDHGVSYTPEQMEVHFQQLVMPGVRAVLPEQHE